MLAVMMTVYSMQFPVGNVRAEEATETKETETGVEGTEEFSDKFDIIFIKSTVFR